MKSAVFVVGLASLIVMAAVSSPPRIASACSAGPDFNPAATADVIVAGRVTDVEIVDRAGVAMFLEVQLTFAVDRYLKGEGGPTLAILDGASAEPPPKLVPNSTAFAALDLDALDVDDLRYAGASGACGALDGDPREGYWVLGVGRHPDTGVLRANRLLRFAVGESPDDPVVLDGVARVAALLGTDIAPPAVGTSGNLGLSGEEDAPLLLLVALFAGAVLILAVGRRASRRS